LGCTLFQFSRPMSFLFPENLNKSVGSSLKKESNPLVLILKVIWHVRRDSEDPEPIGEGPER
jgi:hypothetical protein